MPTKPKPKRAVTKRNRTRKRTVAPRAKSSRRKASQLEKVFDAPLPAPTVTPPPEPVVEEERRGSYDGDTAIKLYLREIGKVPLLTIQEENALAARIKKGDKKAREHMIKANLRLVVKIARDYEGIGLPLLDLISEGNIGLMKAVERFDPSKGGKLSTYGSWWIKQSIKRALANQSKTIRLPVHLVDKISKMRRIALRLHEELGREPSDDEVAGEMGIPTSRVAQMRMAAIRPASLDAPIGDDESNNFSEVVEDENAETPYEQLEDKTVTKMLREMVTPRSGAVDVRTILCIKFWGLGNVVLLLPVLRRLRLRRAPLLVPRPTRLQEFSHGKRPQQQAGRSQEPQDA